MGKFILVTFGFMGWAFYEMSGGADFEPASVRLAEASPVTQKDLSVPESGISIQSVTPNVTGAVVKDDSKLRIDNAVMRSDVDLTQISQAKDTRPDPAFEPQKASFNQPQPAEAQETEIVMQSLIVTDEPVQATNASLQTQPAGDVRIVSGTRVNVRGGPGTNFDVVSQVIEGDAVEVLDDNGDGWVRMRSVDGGPEGWIADFLLVNG